MLKQISSLMLVLVVGGSVFAGGVRISREHVCNMAILNAGPNLETEPEMEVSHMSCMDMAGTDSMPEMEMTGMEHMTSMEMQHSEMPDERSISTIDMPAGEPMPCCKKHQASVEIREPANMGLCCVTIPQEPNSTGPTVNPGSSLSIEVTHATVVKPLVLLPRLHPRRSVTQFFLPNLQATYIRNLAFLI